MVDWCQQSEPKLCHVKQHPIVRRVYNGSLQDHRLGNGLDISQSPAYRPLFFVTVVNRAYGSGNSNELWVAPGGIHKWPTIAPTPNIPSATGYQSTRIIPDIARIKLSLDENRAVRSVCQTVSTIKGFTVTTLKLKTMASMWLLPPRKIETEPIFVVSKQQVAESCTVDINNMNGGED